MKKKITSKDIEYQQMQLAKALNETLKSIKEKEKRFEKVVDGGDFLGLLILWLLHVLFIGFGIFFYFKFPNQIWHLFVFGIPTFFLSGILIIFIYFELTERKVYWREIK